MYDYNWEPIAAAALMFLMVGGWSFYGGVSVLLCHGCGKQIPPSSRFCPNCGIDLYGVIRRAPAGTSFCTECGRPLKAGAKFCGSCGTSTA